VGAREREAKKSARARKKESVKEKKREFVLFPSFVAPHWKPGSRAQIHLAGGKSKGLE
jgi:hypothetical protein